MAMTDVCQVELECLCAAHGDKCARPRCFVRQNITPKWFFNPPIEHCCGVVIDSYQEGHGARLQVQSFAHGSKFGTKHVACSIVHRGSEIEIRCKCKKPAPHAEIVDALCSMYNLN